MKEITAAIENAQHQFRELLLAEKDRQGLTREMYIRFLTMQYHLTKGVQRHFLFIAGHPATAKKRDLRKWLIQFAQEEEFHFEIARMDLENLDAKPGPIPFDTKLWWLFFDDVIVNRPFVRLGATCILENIADGSSDVLDGLIQSSGFLNPKNLKFLTIHRHGPNLAHGDQIIEALAGANLNAEEYADVLEGTRVGTTLYMRFMHWIVTGSEK